MAKIAVRLSWIDVAKAFSIILVVIVHALLGLKASGLLTKGGFLWGVDYYIYTVPLPVFFLFCGMFSVSKKQKEARSFWKAQLERTIYPYFLWGSLQYLAISLFGSVVNHPYELSFSSLASQLFLQNYAQFWFLKALFFMNILYFFSKQIAMDDRFFIVFMLLLKGTSMLVPFPETFIPAATFGLFYAIGVLLSDLLRQWSGHMKFGILFSLCLFVLWVFFVQTAQNHGEVVAVGRRVSESVFPAYLLGLLCLISIAGWRLFDKATLLLYIGKRTMPIFILHLFFVAGVRVVLIKLLNTTNIAIVLPAIVLAGIVGPIIVYEMAARFGLVKKLGLA